MMVTLDFETYYSQDYSLTRMSEAAYICDQRFQVIMLAVKLDDGPVKVYTDFPDIGRALSAIDWPNACLLCHNTRFDGAILAWHYNIKPKIYLDTLSMARAITHARTGSSALAAVARHLKLPAKGDTVRVMIGRTAQSLSAEELSTYADYCAHDTDLCYTIFRHFTTAHAFPVSELRVIDLALRMYIEPTAQLDAMKLAEYLHLVRSEKAQALAALSYVDKTVFSSNKKFAQLLEAHGVTVPTKISPATGEETYALARGDRAFKELCADPDQSAAVQALLSVRVGVKSTIDETRTVALLALAQLPALRSYVPVPYKFYGAHTGRFSGDGGYNFANLRRGSPIRDAIHAPAGRVVVHRDASQIECRVLAWVAGCEILLEGFREGRDIYSEFASIIYGRDITKANKAERFTGKTAVLSLGYGAGAARFRHALYIGQGGMSIDLTEAEAQRVVDLYRNTYREIRELWDRADGMLHRMIHAAGRPLGAVRLTDFLEIPGIIPGDDCINLPNGLSIQYPNLRFDPSTQEKTYDGPYASETKVKIYGGKVIENICQALARIIVTDIMLRVYKTTNLRPFMTTYDSLDYICPAEDAEAFSQLLEHEFSTPPVWASTLPLASEGGTGPTLLMAEGAPAYGAKQ
jgi:hypothetical protein